MKLYIAHHFDRLGAGDSCKSKPHLTITPPVEADPASVQEMIKSLDAESIPYIKESRVSRLSASGIPRLVVLFEPNPALVRVHSTLIQKLGGAASFGDNPFILDKWNPHVTLKEGKPLPPRECCIENLTICDAVSKTVVEVIEI